jgi:nitroreductase
MEYPISTINHLFRFRRSVQPAQYTGEKVPNEIINEILENAIYAPTHRLTEPWHFKVFSGESMQHLLAKMAEIYKQGVAPENFSNEKYEKFAFIGTKTSHIIAICMKRDEANRVPEIEEVCAVACAVQNIYLSVTAYKLGGYWSTGGGTYSQTMKDYLQLAEKDLCLGFFYVGAIDKIFPQGKRSPLEIKVEWR